MWYLMHSKKDFEKKIILSILPMDNIEKIAPGDSVLEPGLQFVDNICGAIRLSKSNKDEWEFFDIFRHYCKERVQRKSKKFDNGSGLWYYHAVEMSSWFLVTGCAVNVDSSLFLFKVLAFFL